MTYHVWIVPKRFILIKAIELEDLEYYAEFKRVIEILKSQEYKRKMSKPDRIECTNPFYSIVQHSKLSLLLNVSNSNPFNSTKFFWMDAGIWRFYKNFNLEQKLTGQHLADNSFHIAIHSFAFKDRDFREKNENLIWTSKNFFIGGIMGGTQTIISNVAFKLRAKWKYLLNKNIVNNEQIVLLLVYFDRPELFCLKTYNNWFWSLNLKQIFESLI